MPMSMSIRNPIPWNWCKHDWACVFVCARTWYRIILIGQFWYNAIQWIVSGLYANNVRAFYWASRLSKITASIMNPNVHQFRKYFHKHWLVVRVCICIWLIRCQINRTFHTWIYCPIAIDLRLVYGITMGAKYGYWWNLFAVKGNDEMEKDSKRVEWKRMAAKKQRMLPSSPVCTT